MDTKSINLIVKDVFKDTYNLYTKYHGMENTVENWDKVCLEAEELYKKYDDPICKKMTLLVIEQLEREYKV
jgi:hypothetical protein